jgi:hypothetical protein
MNFLITNYARISIGGDLSGFQNLTGLSSQLLIIQLLIINQPPSHHPLLLIVLPPILWAAS